MTRLISKYWRYIYERKQQVCQVVFTVKTAWEEQLQLVGEVLFYRRCVGRAKMDAQLFYEIDLRRVDLGVEEHSMTNDVES